MESQRIIKAEAIRELGQKVVFDFADFQKQCREQAAENQQHIQRVLKQAEQEASSLQEQAKKEGFQAGYQAGMEAAEAEIQKRADAHAQDMINHKLKASMAVLENVAQSINDARVEWLSRWESAAIDLCVAISEKIIRSELDSRPDLSQPMIRELMEIAASGSRLIARLHPEDVETLERSREAWGGLPRWQETMELRADASMNRGDCTIESEHGTLDGRIKTQLKRISAELAPEQDR